MRATYDVYACRLPDGKPIPANGWRSFESAHADSVVTNTCGVGGALSEYFPIYPGSLEYLATLDAWPAATDATIERCVASSAAPCDISLSRPFERAGLRHASISFGLRSPKRVVVSFRPGQDRFPSLIQSARVTLDDQAPPAFSSSPVLDGTQAAVAVTDVGAGVSTVQVDLDGRLVGRSEAACAPPFLEPVPCPGRKNMKFPSNWRSSRTASTR